MTKISKANETSSVKPNSPHILMAFKTYDSKGVTNVVKNSLFLLIYLLLFYNFYFITFLKK